MLRDILSHGIGAFIALVVAGTLAFLFIRDITQKKHSVLRNYPVVGRFRYFFEQLGEYFRQYFLAGDRDEMHFNRATRGWVYRLAKNEGGNRHRDIANMDQLLDVVLSLRELTGRPIGVKTAIGGWGFMRDLCEAVLRRGKECAPDFLVIDGGEGGSGAPPQALADHMGLPIAEALPRVIDALLESGLRERIRVVAAGKLVTPAKAAWALCAGADFVTTARGFMFALGCIQALRCHTNTCPTGVTTHNRRLQRGLVVEEKHLRVAQFAQNMNKEIDMI